MGTQVNNPKCLRKFALAMGLQKLLKAWLSMRPYSKQILKIHSLGEFFETFRVIPRE